MRQEGRIGNYTSMPLREDRRLDTAVPMDGNKAHAERVMKIMSRDAHHNKYTKGAGPDINYDKGNGRDRAECQAQLASGEAE